MDDDQRKKLEERIKARAGSWQNTESREIEHPLQKRFEPLLEQLAQLVEARITSTQEELSRLHEALHKARNGGGE